MIDSKALVNALTAHIGSIEKTAGSALTTGDRPGDTPRLQEIIGESSTTPLSWNSQFKPQQGSGLSADPNSPTKGDDIFWNGFFSGARFVDKSGRWWDILSDTFEGAVTIQDVWYPNITAVVSVQAIRASIAAWIQPVYQEVPDAPAGGDDGVLAVRVVE